MAEDIWDQILRGDKILKHERRILGSGALCKTGGEMKFKTGDRVRCIDFEGATGRALEVMPTVLVVYSGFTNSAGEEFVTVGEDDPDAHKESAYVTRFTLDTSLTQDGAAEYDEIMAADALING